MSGKNILTGALVGAHFRPPAKLVLECLPAGARLWLQAEPDNEYDPNAVQVWASPKDIIPESQHSRLEAELPLCGWALDELLRVDAIQLGYVAASKNKILKDQTELVSNEVFLAAQAQIAWADCRITLGFSPSGQPLVIMAAS